VERLHYHRQLPVEEGFDVVVVGGGPSGVAAAVAAGRMGCKVALIEQTGCLGGIGTSGLVNVFMPFADSQSYGIPYRSLIPRGAVNLLVAGRCISADRMVQGSIRVMPCCFITGQAAGAAVALCCEQDVAAAELDPALLQSALRSQGAYIP